MVFILKGVKTVLLAEIIYFKYQSMILRNNVFFYENNFYLKSDISRLSKLISHYEIYKKIQKVEGDIFEFGVFRGVSLIRFLTFTNLFEKKNKRMVFGFDVFGKFPLSEITSDNKFAKQHDSQIGTGLSKLSLEKHLKKKNLKTLG